MKKLILFIAVAIGSTSMLRAQAVTGSGNSGNVVKYAGTNQIEWGVRVGMNVSSFGGDWGDSKKEGLDKSAIGFHLGVIADIPVLENFYVQPGLFFTQKGAKASGTEEGYYDSYDWNEKARPVYLQIPVLASYRFSLTDQLTWHLNVGPYFAFGLGGKFKYTDSDKVDDYDLKLFSGENGGDPLFKRFDAGLSFGTGMSIDKFYVGLAYEVGLVNFAKQDKVSAKNKNFLISVGYNF